MPEELCANKSTVARAAFNLSLRQRITMVALGYIPFFHCALIVSAGWAVTVSYGIGVGVVASLSLLYVLPLVAVRFSRAVGGLSEGTHSIGSVAFLWWWFESQWQAVFNRFPALEEVLRIFPGLYSVWMRGWGAPVGRLVYWSPGVTLFDRRFLIIGDRVVIGADSKICPHFIAKGQSGQTELVLVTISIGDDALVGGSTLIPAGVAIASGEETPGGRPMAPFAQFRDGNHIRTTRFPKETIHEN